ncbi:MAG: ABC transporter permease [Pirellulales bacterium]|nr:ABC transporter permease [Pirellulales bacterium]
MRVGAVLERELRIAPRSRSMYIARAVYTGMLLLIVATCWLVVTGTQAIETAGETGRFAATLLRILAPLQLVLAALSAAAVSAVSVTSEKDRRTLELLLVSSLTDAEIVLGKLAASLLQVLLLLVSAIPVFALVSLFGGVTNAQLARLFAVTAAAAIASASLANAIAFWKETTFQTIAVTLFGLSLWTAAGEVVASLAGNTAAAAFSPARAVFAAIEPAGAGGSLGFLAVCLGVVVASGLVATLRLRPWNLVGGSRYESVRADTASITDTRTVWSRPVLWKELCTRAHGRAIVFVRVAWLALFAAAIWGILQQSGQQRPDRLALALAVLPMTLASLVSVTALAVTSVTTERDRGSLDLLLVSDLEPAEFVWGKLAGVFYVAREMVLLPLAACGVLVAFGQASLENGIYLAIGLSTLLFFSAVLGLHAGLTHGSSRQAIVVALGTVVFLFVGVATVMRIMVSFGGNFELQLAPFLAVVVGGAVGLYAALSARNPSPAIGWASALLPSLTFVAITGFLQGSTLQVLLVTVVAYGFATTAMLVPAIGAFDLLTGRTTGTL